MPIPEETFKHRWYTAGGGELWDSDGTYAAIEFQRLPPLPPSRSPFDWLSLLPPRGTSAYGHSTLECEENEIAGFPSIQSALESLGFNLPEEFELLMTRPDIRGQIPSCTACYLQLSDAVTPLPGIAGSHVVRFMNDQQCCIMWYLLFQPGTPPKVLAAHHFIEPDIFDAMGYLTDEDNPLSVEEALADMWICADSLGEFLFRFCIENAIWFALYRKFPLSPTEQDYLQAAKQG